uniref:Uncharacterized protein n=1 Tax=Anguilla anguilla TaxID=7936 RepID=A0A0E9UIF2_ANGAN
MTSVEIVTSLFSMEYHLSDIFGDLLNFCGPSPGDGWKAGVLAANLQARVPR